MTDVSNLVNQLDCSVEIEVTGMPRHTTKAGVSTIKVPLSSLSRTMQFIHRSGGKVVKVNRLSSNAAVGSVPTATTTPPVEIEAIAVETPAIPEAIAVETPATPEAVVVETTQPSVISTSRSRAQTTAKSGKTTTKRTSKKKK
jgi:hypothetical protein